MNRGWLLILVGCAPTAETAPGPSTEGCRELYAPEAGYGWESDASGLTPEAVERECERQGLSGCDASTFLTRAAAHCIAVAEGLETDPLSLDQHLDVHDDAPTWHLHALIADDGWSSEWHGMMLHAVTGEVLDDLTWTDTPDSTGSS